MWAVLAVALVVGTGVRAGAVEPDREGWWFKPQQVPAGLPVPVTVPPPPNAPPGSLYVAEDPTGPAAVAAVHYTVPVGATATLLLKVNTGSSTTGATVYACPTTAPWGPGENQDWTTRPGYSCGTAPVAGTPSADGTSMTWNLDAALNNDGAIDVALAGSDAGGTPFEVAFLSPDDSSLTTMGGETGEFTVDEGQVTLPSEGTVDFDAGIPQTFIAGDGGSLSVGPTAAPAPATGGPVLRSAPTAVAAPLPFVDSRGDRILAFSLLTLIVLALWWVGGTPVRPPKLLGALANDAGATAGQPTNVAGVGRFARARPEGPRRL
ncbi:MAG: hypothetical protein QOE35_4053 [Actinomycetota bacterium]